MAKNDLEKHLEQQLVESRNRGDQLMVEILATPWTSAQKERAVASINETLGIERQLAALRGEEYAEPFDFPLEWPSSAPYPFLMVMDGSAALTFRLKDQEADGLVLFNPCVSAKLGKPREDEFKGHPLNGRGLDWCAALRVVNSRWLEELRLINTVHQSYDAKKWADMNHYIFPFQDSTFECVARSFIAETHLFTTRQEMLDLMYDRL